MEVLIMSDKKRDYPSDLKAKELIQVQCLDCNNLITKQRGSLRRWSGRCASCATKYSLSFCTSFNKSEQGAWSHEGCFKEKPCLICGNVFKPRSGVHRFCSQQCKGEWKYIKGDMTTDSQYKHISGNWHRYFSRLCCRSHKREVLSAVDLKEILIQQNYKCALSGVALTCKLERGNRCLTNASIDRIDAGGLYVKSNVQLVCTVLNSLRRDTPVDEFINWCKKVAEHNE